MSIWRARKIRGTLRSTMSPVEAVLATQALSFLKSAAAKVAIAQGKKLVGLDSVSKAIRATCKEEGDTELKEPLQVWLDSPDFESFLQMESTRLDDDTVVHSFTSILRLTKYPSADDAMARRVLRAFFAAWHSEQLSGSGAIATADTLSALRDQKTLSAIDDVRAVGEDSREMLRQLQGAMASMQLAAPAAAATKEELDARTRIDAAREMLEGRRPTAARQLLESVANVGNLPLEVRIALRLTLGIAALRCGDFGSARAHFEAVLVDKPGDPGVMSNLSVVATRERRIADAVDFASRAYEKSSDDRGLRVNYAIALWHAQDHSRALEILGEPSEWNGDTELLLTAAQAYANLERPAAMEEIARRALAQDDKNVDALILTATATMATDEDEVHLASRAHLEEAETLFTRALSLIDGEPEDIRDLRAQAYTNRAAVYAQLGNLSASMNDCKAALVIDPDATQARRNLALLFLEQGDTKAAQHELERLRGTDVDDSARILLAQIALTRGEAAIAVDELRPLLEDGGGKRFYAAAEVALQAYRQLPDDVGGTTLRERLQALAANDPDAAAIVALQAEHPESIERLQRAIDAAEGAVRVQLTITLADVYYSQRRYKEAALTYISVLNDRLHKTVLRRYVIAEFNSGNWGAAATYAAHLRTIGLLIPAVVEIEARIFELTGQLERARALYAELEAANPKNPMYRLLSIATLVRDGSTQKAAQDLLTIPIETLTTAESLLAAGALRRELDLADAIEYYYRALALDFANESTQAAFIEAFAILQPAAPESVSDDCNVVMKRGDAERAWTIVPSPTDVHQPGMFAATSWPGSALLGRKIGEAIDLEDGSTWVVSEIQSKHEAMWRRLYGDFRHRFPASSHIRFGDDVEELIDEVKALSRRAEAIRSLYRRGVIGLGAIADLMNQSAVESWAYLYFNGDEHLRAAPGQAGELDAQIAALSADRALLLDASALCTLVELGLADRVAQSFDRVLVASRTREDIETLLAKERQPVRRAMLMTSDGSQVSATDATAERQDARMKYIERIARVVEECLTAVPSPNVAQMNASTRTRVAMRIGESSLAAAAAAQSENAVFCSDDLVAQAIAAEIFNVPCASTLALLKYLNGTQRLSADEYRRCQRALIDARYSFIPTSLDELYDVLVESAFLPTINVMKHLTTLQGPECDEDAAINLLADLVRKAWLGGTIFSRNAMVDLAVSTLCRGRDRARVLVRFRQAIKQRFYLLPQHAPAVDASIRAWQHQNALIGS
jgi:tetratricopeptide (TPR) repeat protein